MKLKWLINNVLHKRKITEEVFNNRMNSLLTKDDYNWDIVKTLLEKSIRPEDMRKMLWKKKNDEDKIDPILEFYTVMFKKYKADLLMTKKPSQAADQVVKAAREKAAHLRNLFENQHFINEFLGNMQFQSRYTSTLEKNDVDSFLLKRCLQRLNNPRVLAYDANGRALTSSFGNFHRE